MHMVHEPSLMTYDAILLPEDEVDAIKYHRKNVLYLKQL